MSDQPKPVGPDFRSPDRIQKENDLYQSKPTDEQDYVLSDEIVNRMNPKQPTGEWTGLTLSRLIKEKGYKGAADAHNAALEEAVDAAHQEILLLQQKLAAERNERRLRTAQLAAERKGHEMDGQLISSQEQQLAAEREKYLQQASAWFDRDKKLRDALAAEREKVQTLVELLEQVLSETVDARDYPDGPCLNADTRTEIKAALAKAAREKLSPEGEWK